MKKTKKQYSKCVRCGSIAMLWVDFGLIGKLGLCVVCWTGVAGCMARDVHQFNKFDEDYIQEMGKAYAREEWFKKEDRKPK